MSAAYKTTRLQLELGPEAYARLQRLKQNTDAASYSEVAKNALKLYATMVDRIAAGGQFCTRDARGNITELYIL